MQHIMLTIHHELYVCREAGNGVLQQNASTEPGRANLNERHVIYIF